MIDTIIDVTGSYSKGILYRFGTHLGEKYAATIKEEGMMEEDPMGPILGMLKASGWFEDSKMEGQGTKLVIGILHPFEEESREQECDFMRGFLAGMGYAIRGLPTFYEEKKEDEWIVFKGESGVKL